MLSREQNELLTRVGRDTPMGRVMRAYWHPVATSAELAQPDGAPVRVKLLGDRYVLFRDTQGRPGLLDESCMHRGASLALGRVENCGIRCLYHGWKFGVDGEIQETPNTRDATVRNKMRARAYPVHEAGGLIWAYVGSPDRVPPFRRFGFTEAPAEHRTVIRVNTATNYLQLWEGGADSSHVGILHSNDARPGWMEESFRPSTDAMNPGALAVEDNCPELECEDTEFGYHYVAMRQAGRNADGTPLVNMRVVPLMMPYLRIIPAPGSYYTVLEVPDDDENTSTYLAIHGIAGPVDRDRVLMLMGLDDPRTWDERDNIFRPTWNDRFGQDRESMSRNWTGFHGIEKEDAIISLSMGRIFDRSQEHLVPGDQAVIRMRQRLFENVKRVESGRSAIGAEIEDLSGLVATDRTGPLGSRWQDLVPQHYGLSHVSAALA